jgi:hypothetical protein
VLFNCKNMTNLTPSPFGTGKATSPWVWVGLGCGTAALLTFGGCVALGILGQRAVKEFSKPVNSKEAIAKLGDIPIYQPSKFNELLTKSVRLSTSVLPGKMFSPVAFDTSDPPNKVLAWYEQQLPKKGYRATSRQSILKNAIQVSFRKQSESIIVQFQDSSTSSRKDYSFVLMGIKYRTAGAKGG